MPKGRYWDGGEKEILLEFASGKWSVESQRGPVRALRTHSTRSPTDGREKRRFVTLGAR
eukprot:COSAG06_NODE_60537_length_270_cov_1.146199_1_plen_58_part_10